jgi:hypothetical protein
MLTGPLFQNWLNNFPHLLLQFIGSTRTLLIQMHNSWLQANESKESSLSDELQKPS